MVPREYVSPTPRSRLAVRLRYRCPRRRAPRLDHAHRALPHRRQPLLRRQPGPRLLPHRHAGRATSSSTPASSPRRRSSAKASSSSASTSATSRSSSSATPTSTTTPAAPPSSAHTHAKYMVMDGDVPVVESGGAKDFAYPRDRYPPAHVDRILHDGDEVRLGGTVLTAHKTPGHTRGCTTWTMRATLDGKPRNVVIVGSWNVNPGFRLVDRPGHPASYPGIAADYQHTFAVLKSSALRHLPRRARRLLRHARQTRPHQSRSRRPASGSIPTATAAPSPNAKPPSRQSCTNSKPGPGLNSLASRAIPDGAGRALPSSPRSSTLSSFRAPDESPASAFAHPSASE